MYKVTNAIRKQINKVRENEAIYYETIGHAVQHIERCLAVVGITLQPHSVMSLTTGTTRLLLDDPEGHEIQNAVVSCSLYRMPSGRYELTWYCT